MTQKETEMKFQKYAELGKALDILRTLTADEASKFLDDVDTITAELYQKELKAMCMKKPNLNIL